MAGIVANTSLTPKDIGEMSYPELEELMEGISKNAEKMRDEINGIKRTTGGMQELVDFIGKNGNSF